LRLRASLRLLAGAAIAIVALPGCGSGLGHARAQPLVVGAVEDAAKFGDADREMAFAADSGFGAVALSAVWTRGLRAPPPAELARLVRATAAAARRDIRPIVAIYFFSSNTPTSLSDEADFAAYAASLARGLPAVRDVIVGNEPNFNLFFLPQYGPAGQDVAATSFERLLATTYDALKGVDPAIQVIGVQPAPGAQVPGIRKWPEAYLPKIFDRGRIDRVIEVTQQESEEMTRRLAREEGIFAGISSGGGLAAALRVSAEARDAVIVHVVCDRGDRYLSTGVFPT